MRRLDLVFPTPAEHLAADEAMLDWCEAGNGEELLAFWEPRETFVVVGYANKVPAEVNVAACENKNIPIFRRCSGGGAVVQMPGGLNYSLILRIAQNSPTRNITSANNFIMEKNRAAIQSLMGREAVIAVRGHTDLAVAPATLLARAAPGEGGSLATSHPSPVTFLKFAGNSQRRRRHFLLFHGTFLLNCDLKLITQLLRMPSLQPDYRASRPHEEFVTNLNIPAATVKNALAQAWQAQGKFDDLPREKIYELARDKYGTNLWNRKF